MTKFIAIALAGFGLAYACLWWSFQRFYGQFGVSPQDVGLTPSGSASDLPGAALQLGVWLLIMLTILAVLPTLAPATVEIAAGFRQDGSRSGAMTAAVAALALLGLSSWTYWFIVDHAKGLVLLAVAFLVFVAVVHVVPWARARLAAATGPAPAGLAASRLAAIGGVVGGIPPVRLALAIFVAAAVVGVAFIDLPDDAAEAGECAAKGIESVPALNAPIPFVHLPVLSVHAQPASLTGVGQMQPPGGIGTKGVVFLGQSSGTVVVYDLATKQAARIPSGTVVVLIKPDVPHCPSVH